MVYIVALFGILFGCILFDFSSKYDKYSFPYYISCILILILVAGLRYRIGSDTKAYMTFFETVPAIDKLRTSFFIDNQGFEPGWIFLNSLIKTLGLGFYSLQTVHAIFVNGVIGRAIWKICKYKYLSLLCYVIILYPNFNFEILRQSVSIGLFIIGCLQVANKNYSWYYLCVLLAFLFHYSAIILVFIPLLLRILDKLIKSPYLLMLLSIIVYISSFILKMSVAELMLLVPGMYDKSFVYFANIEESSFSVSFIFNLLFNVGLPIFIIQFIGKHMFDTCINCYIRRRLLHLSLAICCVSVLFYCLSANLPIFYRFYWYFLFFGTLLYPYIVDIMKYWGLNKIFGLIMVLSILLFKGRAYVIKDKNDIPIYYKYYPYSSCFNEFKDSKREFYFGE